MRPIAPSLSMSTTSSTKSTSSSHDTPGARLNEGTAAKEVRAHEHARHRTKERRDHALAKERKEKAAAVRVLGLKGTQAHETKLTRKLSMEGWDGERGLSVAKTPVRQAVTGTPVQAPKPERDAVSPTASTHSFTAWTLGDFMSSLRRPKAKQFDFEVIPPIRAVIALDDDADEPWEYITRASVNDGSAWKGKTYAQAVTSAM